MVYFLRGGLGAYVDSVEELNAGMRHHTIIASKYRHRTKPIPVPARQVAEAASASGSKEAAAPHNASNSQHFLSVQKEKADDNCQTAMEGRIWTSGPEDEYETLAEGADVPPNALSWEEEGVNVGNGGDGREREGQTGTEKRKRKRKRKTRVEERPISEAELNAERRHQEARDHILRAHAAFLEFLNDHKARQQRPESAARQRGNVVDGELRSEASRQVASRQVAAVPALGESLQGTPRPTPEELHGAHCSARCPGPLTPRGLNLAAGEGGSLEERKHEPLARWHGGSCSQGGARLTGGLEDREDGKCACIFTTGAATAAAAAAAAGRGAAAAAGAAAAGAAAAAAVGAAGEGTREVGDTTSEPRGGTEDAGRSDICRNDDDAEAEVDWVSLGATWQARLCQIEVPQASDGGDSLPGAVWGVFDTMVENGASCEVAARSMGHTLILPARSRFLMSDITRMRPLLPAKAAGLAAAPATSAGASARGGSARGASGSSSGGGGYNMVVIDPPWENKSVRRNASYPTLPNRRLLELPVRQLAGRRSKEGALVALWITNREKLRSFAENELFPRWGVRHLATWYWLKVTEEGEMISTLDNPHHRPYETLLLGHLAPHDDPAVSPAHQDGATWQSPLASLEMTALGPPGPRDVCENPARGGDLGSAGEDGGGAEAHHCQGQLAPEDNFVIVSEVGEHSRKPPLDGLLRRFVPGEHDVAGLELFARELRAGWASWGNEPLRFQSSKYFQAL